MDLAGVEHSLADLERELPRHEGRRPLGEPVVQLGSILAGDLEDVAEALGDEERSSHAPPLQQGVGRDRGAVDEEGDVLRPEARLPDDLADPLLDPGCLVGGRRRGLGEMDPVAVGVEENEVGEGAAHVHAKSHVHRAVRMACQGGRRGADGKDSLG